MKNKIMRLMGVVLTLSLLAGLIMAAVPVSAGDLNWSNVTIPNTTNFQVTTTATNISAFAAAPDGKTLFAYDTGASKLYKSVDAGVTWTTTSLGTNLGAGITMIKVSPQYSSDTNIVAANATTVYRSVNGGSDWFVLTPTLPWAATNVTSVDVATYYNGGGPAILIGYGSGSANGGLALYITYQGSWYYSGTGSDNWGGSVDVWNASFSPNYQTDTAIYAVTSNTTTQVKGRVGTGAWGADIAGVELKYSGAAIATAATESAKIAFPSDFDYASTTNNKMFIAVSGAAGFPTAGDIWRVKVGTAGTAQQNQLSAGLGIISGMAYVGNSAAGTLVAADINGGVENSTDAVSNNSPTWNGANTPPVLSAAGTTAPKLQYSATGTASAPLLFAVTSGNKSAFYTSTDSSVFNAQSLINIGGTGATISAYKISGTTTFLQIKDANTPTTYWNFKSVNNGPFKVMFPYTVRGTGADAEALSGINPTNTFATDQTIFINTQVNNASTFNGAYGNVIYKSTDSGATWTHFTAPGDIKKILSFAIVDANNYYVTGWDKPGIYKNGTYTAIDLDNNTVNLKPYNPTFWTATTTLGGIYVSQDAGTTWTRLGTGTEFVNSAANLKAIQTFNDPANKTVYALQGIPTTSYDLVKYVVGTSSSWETVKTIQDISGNNITSVGYTAVVNGIFYLTGTVSGNTYLYRATSLYTKPDMLAFEIVPNTLSTSFGAIGSPSVNQIVAGKGVNTLNLATADVGSFATNGYNGKISSFTDSLVSGPETVSPKANDQVGATADFSWKAIQTTQTLKYDIQIAYDNGFNSQVAEPTAGMFSNISGTILANVNLPSGKQLYWRVRVSPGDPMSSGWSPAVAFTTSATSVATPDLNAGRGPAAGATTNTTPVFTWGTIPNATYDFKLSKDPTFPTTGTESKTGLTANVYTPTTKLDANTNYFWEVRAVQNGIPGDWVASAFTTGGAAPTGTGTTGGNIVVTVPPQPQPTVIVTVAPGTTGQAPGTPAYIWVIIAIGAVLVIAVIVLIARTRRV